MAKNIKSAEIYTEKLKKGNRTYFFDIKKSTSDSFYLKINESRKKSEGFEHNRLIVFEEDLEDFSASFLNAVAKFEDLTQNMR